MKTNVHGAELEDGDLRMKIRRRRPIEHDLNSRVPWGEKTARCNDSIHRKHKAQYREKQEMFEKVKVVITLGIKQVATKKAAKKKAIKVEHQPSAWESRLFTPLTFLSE